MSIYMRIVGAFALISWALLGCNKVENYEDCVIDGVKSATVPAVIATVKEACKAKFPDAKGVEIEFDNEMLAKITGKAEITDSLIQGSLYHSNKGWIVTRIEIAVYPSQMAGLSQEAISKVAKLYAYNLKLPEFQQETFAVSISNEHLGSSTWSIVSAKGILRAAK